MNLGKNYKVFSGDARNSLPAMKKEDYGPLTMLDVNKNRVDVIKNKKNLPDWTDNYFDTIDADHSFKDGSHKLVRNDSYIKNINSKSELTNGNYGHLIIFMGDEEWEKLTGKNVLHLSREKVEKLHGKPYTEDTILDSEFWNWALITPKNVSNFAKYIFPEMKKRFGYEEGARVCFNSAGDFHKASAWCLDGLGSGSNADAKYSVGNWWGSGFVGFKGREVGKKLEKQV